LALSRADASAIGAQPMQRVDLKNLCESVLQVHLDAASAKQIDLGLEAQTAQVWGYEWLLRELLANLVDNAVKYTPPGGTVTLRCSPVAGSDPALPPEPGEAAAGMVRGAAVLEVEDDGPGIAPAERAMALQRFYRVRGTGGEGNGLGLAIADEIARLHRSQLELGFAVRSGDTPHGLRVRLRL
ncbi:MAG: HAMP domain-containing histidine kinase, partial [Haliea sp.]